MNIILLGPPGTGKGTIAKFIELRFGNVHISTGDLLRDEVANSTSIGKKIEPILNSGQLVDDGTVIEILKERFEPIKGRPFVLDGFPRNLQQAKLLDLLVKEIGLKIDFVLAVESSEDVIVKRLSARRQCVKCKRIFGLDVPSRKEGVCDDCGSHTVLRKDDEPEIVMSRLRLYSEITRPLIGFYRNKKLLKVVDGNGSLQDIFMEVEKLLSSRGAG